MRIDADKKSMARLDRTGGFSFRAMLAGTFALSVCYTLDLDFGAGFSVAGLDFLSTDLVCAVLITIIALRYARRMIFTPLERIFLILLAFTALEFVRGVAMYGTNAALEFRQTLQWLVAIMFAAEFRGIAREKLVACLGLLAAATLLVYFGRILGFISWSFHAGYSEFRFVSADQAIALCIFSVACLALSLYGTKGRAAFLYGAVGLVTMAIFFAMMHRSVWLAAFTGTITLIAGNMRYRMMNLPRFIIFTLIALGVVIAIGVAIAASPVLQAAIFEVSRNYSTANWRINGWKDLLSELNLFDLLTGKGFGASYGRWINGGFVDVQAHNFYVEKLWELGVFGFALNMLFFGWIVVTLMRIAGRPHATGEDRGMATMLLALVMASFAFFVAYSAYIPNGLAVGGAMAFIRERAPQMIPLRIAFSTTTSRALRRHPAAAGKPGVS